MFKETPDIRKLTKTEHFLKLPHFLHYHNSISHILGARLTQITHFPPVSHFQKASNFQNLVFLLCRAPVSHDSDI